MSEHSEGRAEVLERDGGRPLPRTSRGGRRRLVRGVAVVAVLATAAGAVWAWQAFMEQGPQPAEALPASTLGYVAVDFDPGAGQKLAALSFLRKFPSIEDRVGVADAGDLRKDVFRDLEADLGCGLDYADVEPWLGQRFAFAVVQQDGPKPVAVLQVSDHERAAAGLKRVAACADGELGYALGQEWAVIAESDQIAESVQRAAAQSPLAEDADFQRWTGEAGEPGIVTLYAAPEAGPAIVAAVEKSPYGSMYLMPWSGFDPVSIVMGMTMTVSAPVVDYAGEDHASATSEAVPPGLPRAARREQILTQKDFKRLETMTPAEQDKFFERKFGRGEGFADGPGAASDVEVTDEVTDEVEVIDEEEFAEDPFPAPALPADLRTALMNFSGLGGVVRFDEGALELEMVSDRIEGTMGNLVAGAAGDDVLAKLPSNSAAAFGAGLREDWVGTFLRRFAEQSMPFGGAPPADPAAAFEKNTGLTSADLDALGGDSFALVAGPGLDPDAIYENPNDLKVAARVSGGADQVEVALAKVKERVSGLQSRRVGDDVLVGINPGYLDELAAAGDLVGTGSFQRAVPGAGDAASVVYLNFDAGDWLARSMSQADRADAEPLAAAGYSLHDEGNRERTLIRLTTED